MSRLPPQFKYRLASLFGRMKNIPLAVDGVSLSLPFFSLSVKPLDTEKRAAREIVIRIADRPVLNAFECCDGCIKNALDSLRKLRSMLVDRQVGLADRADGMLYLMTELMVEGIRQFLTFEEWIQGRHDRRELYQAGLESPRCHLHLCLVQVARLAQIEIPHISKSMRYDQWALESYEHAAPLKRGEADDHRG